MDERLYDTHTINRGGSTLTTQYEKPFHGHQHTNPGPCHSRSTHAIHRTSPVWDNHWDFFESHCWIAPRRVLCWACWWHRRMWSELFGVLVRVLSLLVWFCELIDFFGLIWIFILIFNTKSVCFLVIFEIILDFFLKIVYLPGISLPPQ